MAFRLRSYEWVVSQELGTWTEEVFSKLEESVKVILWIRIPSSL
jgi:hypothetical protein